MRTSLRIVAVIFLCVVSVGLAIPQKANAHVFFTDKSGKHGLIMHLVPDDDPIAGSNASFYFDVSDKELSTERHYYRLFITNKETNQQSQAATYKIDEQNIGATFTFPSQGTYLLELYAYPLYDPVNPTAAREPVVFSHSQAVTRGITNSPLDKPRYAWAEFGMIAAGFGVVMLAVIVASRYRVIAKFTKW